MDKSYKHANKEMAIINNAIHRVYDIGYADGRDEKNEHLKLKKDFFKKFANDGRWKCIICKEEMIAQYPFCPWCGRRMDYSGRRHGRA